MVAESVDPLWGSLACEIQRDPPQSPLTKDQNLHNGGGGAIHEKTTNRDVRVCSGATFRPREGPRGCPAARAAQQDAPKSSKKLPPRPLEESADRSTRAAQQGPNGPSETVPGRMCFPSPCSRPNSFRVPWVSGPGPSKITHPPPSRRESRAFKDGPVPRPNPE
jgi:hypothetical protein